MSFFIFKRIDLIPTKAPFNQLHLTILLVEAGLTDRLFPGGMRLSSWSVSCEPPAWASIQGPAASIPTRPAASSIRSSSGRAMEQIATLRRGSIIAKCVQGEARRLLGDHFSRFCLIPCNFFMIVHRFGTQVLFFRPVNSISDVSKR